MCNIPRIGGTLDGAGLADNEGNPKPATPGTQKPQRAAATPQSQPAPRMLKMQVRREWNGGSAGVSKNLGARGRQRNVVGGPEGSNQNRQVPRQSAASAARGQRIRVGLFLRRGIVRQQPDRVAARGRQENPRAGGVAGASTGCPSGRRDNRG